MKLPNAALPLLLLLLLLTACKKSGTNNNPQPSNDLIGTWHVEYYVAANIVVGPPNDTLYASHNESWTFSEDSLFCDSWFVTWYDQTTSPPTFTVTDTNETKGAYSYTKNGNTMTSRSPTRQETFDILTLTNNRLVLREAINPQAGFSDYYISLTK